MMSLLVRTVEPEDLDQLTELMYQYIVDFYNRPKPSVEKVHHLIQILLVSGTKGDWLNYSI